MGDLGGVPIIIPPHVADLVEYDHDPGWGEERKGPTLKRTFQSKLSSFGVDFRYPDMATLSSPEMSADKNSKSMYVTDWMSFGVESGSRAPHSGWLDWATNSALTKGVALHYIYAKQPLPAYGLTWHLLVDKSTGKPPVDSPVIVGDSLYVARNSQGQVIANIRCSTATHAAAPCSHRFSMDLDGMRAAIDISYRRPDLEHWRDIQDKVRLMILSFKRSAATPSPSEK